MEETTLKPIIHALLKETKLLHNFNDFIDAKFLNNNPAYIIMIQEAYKYISKFNTRIDKNILIDILYSKTKTNKELKKFFEETLVDLYVDDIYSQPYNVDYIAYKVMAELKDSHMYTIIEQALLRKEKDQTFSAYDFINTSLDKLNSKFNSLVVNTEEVNFNTLTVEDIEDVCSHSENYDSIIFTNFPSLDKYKMYLNKDYSELGLVIAPPSKGKTAYLSHLAYHAAMQGFAVLYLEGETAKDVMKKRFGQTVTTMTLDNIASKQYRGFAESQLNGFKRCGGLYILQMFNYGAFTVKDIETRIDDYIEKYNRKPDCLFIDYADLMSPVVFQTDYRLKLKQIFIELKALCMKYKIACWTASQTNRSGLNTVLIDMENIAEDFSKNMIIDKAFSINRIRHSRDDEAYLYIVKNRDGYFDRLIKTEADFSRMFFKEICEIENIDEWKTRYEERAKEDKKEKKKSN